MKSEIVRYIVTLNGVLESCTSLNINLCVIHKANSMIHLRVGTDRLYKISVSESGIVLERGVQDVIVNIGSSNIIVSALIKMLKNDKLWEKYREISFIVGSRWLGSLSMVAFLEFDVNIGGRSKVRLVSNRNEAEIFQGCMFGLLEYLRNIQSDRSTVGGILPWDRFELWSEYDGNWDLRCNCVHLKFCKSYIKFALKGVELFPVDLSENFNYTEIKKVTSQVKDCIEMLGYYKKPISSIRGYLSYIINNVVVTDSRTEKGAVDIELK